MYSRLIPEGYQQGEHCWLNDEKLFIVRILERAVYIECETMLPCGH